MVHYTYYGFWINLEWLEKSFWLKSKLICYWLKFKFHLDIFSECGSTFPRCNDFQVKDINIYIVYQKYHNSMADKKSGNGICLHRVSLTHAYDPRIISLLHGLRACWWLVAARSCLFSYIQVASFTWSGDLFTIARVHDRRRDEERWRVRSVERAWEANRVRMEDEKTNEKRGEGKLEDN